MKYSNDIICNILNYIGNNFIRRITIEDISLYFSYNSYYLMKLFRKEIGMSIITFTNHLRIYHSLIDLQSSSYSCTRIALKNGFYSLEYFSEVFRQVLGVSPREYLFFYKNRYLQNEAKINVILTRWEELQLLIEKIEKYKKNRKPSVLPVKKLSIFS